MLWTYVWQVLSTYCTTIRCACKVNIEQGIFTLHRFKVYKIYDMFLYTDMDYKVNAQSMELSSTIQYIIFCLFLDFFKNDKMLSLMVHALMKVHVISEHCRKKQYIIMYIFLQGSCNLHR